MLCVCATPIGNLGDVTLRVLEVLQTADLIAAEDTRRTRRLLAHHDIHTPLTSFHEHNEAGKAGQLLARLRAGETVALVSDAGMPLVSDPGARLVADAVREGLDVVVLPGASAVITALVVSGLAGEGGFRFVGYLPRRRALLQESWRRWRREGGPIVAFESPRRLARSLEALAAPAPDAAAAVCRELTKLHEGVDRGTLGELAARYSSADVEVRGEITLVLDAGPGEARQAVDQEAAAETARALLGKRLSKRDAAAALTICLGLRHRDAERLVRAVSEEDGASRPQTGRRLVD